MSRDTPDGQKDKKWSKKLYTENYNTITTKTGIELRYWAFDI
jgi:hypothetical protein